MKEYIRLLVFVFIFAVVFKGVDRLIPSKVYYYICVEDNNGKHNCEALEDK